MMPLSYEHLFEPTNPYNKYVPILRQSLVERWESTVRILGGRYCDETNPSILAGIKKRFANGMFFYHPSTETGILADLALAFVFDYTADKCSELRRHIEKTTGFLHLMLSMTYPCILMVEMAATAISILLRSILSRVVALALLPVILLAHAVCAWQERVIQNKIDAVIKTCDDGDQSELNILKKVLYEDGKKQGDQYVVSITSPEEPEYFLFKNAHTSFDQANDPQEGSKNLERQNDLIQKYIFRKRNPNKVKVFVQFSDGVFVEVNFNLASIKNNADPMFMGATLIKAISMDNEALLNVLHEAAKDLNPNKCCTIDANKIAPCLNTNNKISVALFKSNIPDASNRCHLFSFFPSSKTLNALESMAELTFNADYISEVTTNKTLFPGL